MRPYLVRRGGGVKVRGENNNKNSLSKIISENVEPVDVQFKKFKASLPALNDKPISNVCLKLKIILLW